jgi:chemotaxis protein CheD
MAVVDVPTAGHALAEAPDSLATSGIGSCIAVCFYDQETKKGGLIHFMLPRAEEDTSNYYRYADTAITDILCEFVKLGVNKNKLTAKIIGGAQMFPGLEQIDNHGKSIGERNIEEVILLLNTIGIPVVGRSIRGNEGKSISFDLSTGMVAIHSLTSKDDQII